MMVTIIHYYKSDQSVVDQIAELQKNLIRLEQNVTKDKEWLWRNDPVREKKARYGLG